MSDRSAPALSRRQLLTGVIAAGGALAVGAACRGPRAATASQPRLLGIDMHNHVYPAGTEPHPHAAAPQADDGGALPLRDALARSGFTAVCACYVLDFAQNDAPGDAFANLERWLTAVDAALAAGHLRRALTAADLQAAHAGGASTILQGVEGAMFIEGKLERIEDVHRRGLRQLQLLHEHDDMVAPLGDTNAAQPRLGGLTAIGADVIKACNRLGILVDLAHASHETVLGALRVATKPVVISHTSLAERTGGDPRQRERLLPRLLTKDHARAVADAGGVVGVWTKLADSVPDFVGSIAAMVDAIGVDHVGIGTDTDLLSRQPGKGLMPLDTIAAQMQQHGFHGDEIARIAGGNYLRVFAQATS